MMVIGVTVNFSPRNQSDIINQNLSTPTSWSERYLHMIIGEDDRGRLVKVEPPPVLACPGIVSKIAECLELLRPPKTFSSSKRKMVDVPQGKQTVNDSEILEYMRSDSDPAYSTSELADQFGMSTEGMRVRLEDLRTEALIHKKKPTERTVLWWSHEDESEPVSVA